MALEAHALQQALEANRRQWEDLASLVNGMQDRLAQAIESAQHESNLRLEALAKQVEEPSPALAARADVSPSRSERTQLKQIDCNVPTNVSSQRSSQAARQDVSEDKLERLADRLLQAERELESTRIQRDGFKAERDDIQGRYKRERSKFKSFKAWWEANIPSAVEGGSSKAAAQQVDSDVNDDPEHPRGAKRRRLGDKEPETQSNAKDTATVGPGRPDTATASATGSSKPAPSASSVHTAKDGPTLRYSFTNMHLTPSEKKLIRSVGLPLPPSPAKRALPLPKLPTPSSPPLPVADRVGQPLESSSDLAVKQRHAASPSVALSGSLRPSYRTPWKPPALSNALDVDKADGIAQLTVLQSAQGSEGAADTTVSESQTSAKGGQISLLAVKTEHTVVQVAPHPQEAAGPSTSRATTTTSKATATKRVRYDLDPKLNQGEAYEYTEVVRGREARRTLIAAECLDCKEWYERVGPSLSPPGPVYEPYGSLGAQLKAAREERKAREGTGGRASGGNGHHVRCRHHREDVEGPPDHDDGELLEENDQRQAHRQAISRHRNTAPVSSTPPGFWEISFPSEERAQALNDETEIRRQEHQTRLARDRRYKPRVTR